MASPVPEPTAPADTRPDPLAALGLTPAVPEGSAAPAADPVVPAAPVAPAPVLPAPTDTDVDSEIVVPPGAENPDAVIRAIQAERKTAREANARAREYKRLLDEREEQALPLEDRIKRAEEAAAEATIKALRFEVAAASGLDLQLASRLQGTTREELLADAESLKGLIPASPAPVVPGAPPEGGFRTPAPTPVDPQLAHGQLIGALLQGAQANRGSRPNPLAGLEPAPED